MAHLAVIRVGNESSASHPRPRSRGVSDEEAMPPVQVAAMGLPGESFKSEGREENVVEDVEQPPEPTGAELQRPLAESDRRFRELHTTEVEDEVIGHENDARLLWHRLRC